MSASEMITAAHLRDRLAGTRKPRDPTDVVMPPGSEHWPQGMREQLTASLQPAGVLIPVIEHGASGLSLLLTQRSAELKHHAGQVSFPGGRMEIHDADIVATALREAHEEVGIAQGDVTVIGCLSPMPTITGYAVTPIVGLIDGGIELQLDATEVEYAFEVPLMFLLDPRNKKMVERDIDGRMMTLAEFHYGGERIWGATAFIIQQLIKILNK
ncbi:MAG: CoA pyrophosphatase [Gammaproteobacteria bacterium]|nr:CoA pyrophosphatase [Gammaproteobacteria bacterium]MDH3750721.1 CoA pyrophosphatase [Gammaproteobacteria bacterium]